MELIDLFINIVMNFWEIMEEYSEVLIFSYFS